MSTSVRKEYAHFKDSKFNKVAIFNGIELIQVECSSRPCTLSLYNAFMWTVSVKAGQSELNEARLTNERTKKRKKERTHHVDFLKMTRQKKTHSKYYNILIEIEIIVKLSI